MSVAEPLLIAAGLLILLAWLGWRGRRSRLRLLAAVAVERLELRSRFLRQRRTLSVYLPPGYSAAPARPYPLLLLNDGQDAGALRLRETLARLAAAGRIESPIVVAIPTGAGRLQEYGTAGRASSLGLGRRARAYSRFVVEEALPLVAGRYPIAAQPEGVAILGASLGGLSAFDIAWNHPDVFGAVGVLSGSFWWSRKRRRGEPAGADRRLAHEMARQRPAGAARPRVWLQAGSRDEIADRDHNGVIDAIQDSLELAALMTAGGGTAAYVEVPFGRHDPATWAGVLPDFLVWAFGRRPVS
ncbi:MAG: alpha/beta hydrolase [Candidatus Promineifilaceae bacterium]